MNEWSELKPLLRIDSSVENGCFPYFLNGAEMTWVVKWAWSPGLHLWHEEACKHVYINVAIFLVYTCINIKRDLFCLNNFYGIFVLNHQLLNKYIHRWTGSQLGFDFFPLSHFLKFCFQGFGFILGCIFPFSLRPTRECHGQVYCVWNDHISLSLASWKCYFVV